jgi:hypothetical protein
VELEEFVRAIDEAIARAARHADARYSNAVATLAESLLADGPPEAMPAMRRLVGCPLVPMRTRDAMLERLVRAGDAQAKAAVFQRGGGNAGLELRTPTHAR